MRVYQKITDLIGGTPLLELTTTKKQMTERENLREA